MAKSLEGIQLALFFAQTPEFRVEDLCKAATGADPDATERQKATGVATAMLLEEKVQVRFVLSPVRCDIYFAPVIEPSEEFPPRSAVPFGDVLAFATRIGGAAAAFVKEAQRVGVVIVTVEDFASSADSLASLKKGLPFEFGAPDTSEDVVVQYNIRADIQEDDQSIQVNQLFNNQTGMVQMIHVGPNGANVVTKSALRQTLDVNTHPEGALLSGKRLSSATASILSHARSLVDLPSE